MQPYLVQSIPRHGCPLFGSGREAPTALGCLQALAAALLRIWDRGAGRSPPPHARTPWAVPSQCSGFRAGEGCGQTGSEARPRVRLQLSRADKTPGLQHNFLAFHPSPSLSIPVLALWEGLGDGGKGAHFDCLGHRSNMLCGRRNPAELAACREFSHRCLSHWNSVTSRVSELSGLGLLAALLAAALPRALALHHLPEAVLGEKFAPCGLWDFFSGRVAWTGGDRESPPPPPSTGWDCAAESPRLFRGRKVPTLVSPDRGESPTYSHVTPEK